MSTWWGDSKNMEEIEFSRWLFEGRSRQGKNVLPDGLNWLCYLAGSSKSHRENSISCIFLESPYQVDLKNIVKCYKYFFGYFNALESHSAMIYSKVYTYVSASNSNIFWPNCLKVASGKLWKEKTVKSAEKWYIASIVRVLKYKPVLTRCLQSQIVCYEWEMKI